MGFYVLDWRPSYAVSLSGTIDHEKRDGDQNNPEGDKKWLIGLEGCWMGGESEGRRGEAIFGLILCQDLFDSTHRSALAQLDM